MSLVTEISKSVGFPFGIRATAKRFYKTDGTLPSGSSNNEGLDGGTPRLHFFVVDQKAIEDFSQQDLDLVLKRTIIKSVTEYPISHALGKHWGFLKGFEEDATPVLYFFNAGQNYCRDRYAGAFSEINGLPTFPEADSDKDRLISPRGIFTIETKDYHELDPKARTLAHILTPTISVDDDLGRCYFKHENSDGAYKFFRGMHEYQRDLIGAIPRGYKFRMPSKKEVERLLQDEKAFLSAFNRAYLMNEISNLYLDELYNKFAERIFSTVKGRFINQNGKRKNNC